MYLPSLHPDEERTIRTFVTAERRDKLLRQLPNPGKRAKALASLNHFKGWDTRYAKYLPFGASVLDTLHAMGSPSHCYIIAENPTLDTKTMKLGDAILAAESSTSPTLLCCVPDRLAFFFDEIWAPRRRVLLAVPVTA
jgi:hypothetical protein